MDAKPISLFPYRKDTLRGRLFAYYQANPRAEHYVRDLAGILRVDPTNLSRELRALASEGVFRSRREGTLKYFSLNPQPVNRGRGKHRLYVVAGPNGAGKTTFAKVFLPKVAGSTHFINADLIAAGVAPLAPEQAALKAGKLLLAEIESASQKGIDFGFETTLSGESCVNLFRRMIERGYEIHLFFLWIPTLEQSLKRIEARVKRGGHFIPDDVVKQRFHRGLHHLFHLYAPLLYSWAMFDNSDLSPALIAYQEDEHRTIIEDAIFRSILKKAGAK
jgi:predicted ABC-type ATPase